MDKRRIFIAIDVPGALKNIAESYLEPFFKERSVRIPKKEGWHITVVFCGYLDETETGALQDVVEKAVSQNKPFRLTPLKIVFAPENRPRMVWLTFGSSEFAKLKLQIQNGILAEQRDACLPARQGLFRGFSEERRDALPHLTLARFEERDFLRLKKFLPQEGADIYGEAESFEADSINIMESRLSREGAEYEVIKNFKF